MEGATTPEVASPLAHRNALAEEGVTSAVVFLDADKQNIEFGIDPDLFVNLKPEDKTKNLDTIIETARTFLK